jgi:phage FluMu gp28-like protein
MSLSVVLDNTTSLVAPAVLLDYQKDWIRIRAPLKVGEKSRRIDLTWLKPLITFLWAAAEKPAGGQTVYWPTTRM